MDELNCDNTESKISDAVKKLKREKVSGLYFAYHTQIVEQNISNCFPPTNMVGIYNCSYNQER